MTHQQQSSTHREGLFSLVKPRHNAASPPVISPRRLTDTSLTTKPVLKHHCGVCVVDSEDLCFSRNLRRTCVNPSAPHERCCVGSTQPADSVKHHPHSAAFPATFSTTDFECISERSTIMASILEILITASV